MAGRISYAQNGEDIRVWRAFRDADQATLRYVDVGANEPFSLSITASLYALGWRGVLVEADPDLAAELRISRPEDTVVSCAAAAGPGELVFHRVPGTGLGSLDEEEAASARARGFAVEPITVLTDSLDAILDRCDVDEIHFMSIDVEGAEASVLSGLDLRRHRPWILCIEAIRPGQESRSEAVWEPRLLASGYRFAAFDGVNCWYVSEEHAELAGPVATPFNALDSGLHGWRPEREARVDRLMDRHEIRQAWQRELILNDVRSSVPEWETRKRISELSEALAIIEGSRSWRVSRTLGGVVRRTRAHVRAMLLNLPGPLGRAVVRARHLRHVRGNLTSLVDPAFLGRVDDVEIGWIAPDGMPPVPPAGLDLAPPTVEEQAGIRSWLAEGPFDSDLTLDLRMDNHDDELGRVVSALRTRLRLALAPDTLYPAAGNRVLVDARSLQTPAFGTRGIGRFVAAALSGVRGALGDEKVTLLVDRGLTDLPESIRGTCELITRVDDATVGRFSVLIQPSPMTASSDPLLPLLHSTAHRIAVVYDFIPMHYPSVYLRTAGARAEYAAALDALRYYDEFVCISHIVQAELKGVIGSRECASTVAWPKELARVRKVKAGSPDGPIVVMTGDEPRKNTYGALAAIGAATAGLDQPRNVLVIGMAGQDTRVHHWSIHAAMRPGEATTAGRMSDAQLRDTLHRAALVVVPSFDEGLSLPVIEALMSGANVVASDIPAHRELIGRGSYLVNPRDVRAMARRIRRYAGTRRSYPRQRARLLAHAHEELEQVLARSSLAKLGKTTVSLPPSRVHVAGRRQSVGLATPWTPQKSGVADFSAAVGRELATMVDLTVYTTSDARVEESIASRPVDALLSGDPVDHDILISVIGNSHFHTPFVELLKHRDAVAVLHDTRMVEYYVALRGRGGAEQVMLRRGIPGGLQPSLDEQIADMRLLQDLGLWEIARRARAIIMHSPSAASLVANQTGVIPLILPFANQRVPEGPVDAALRRDARSRLGWGTEEIHLGSFGYVDIRTKMSDLVVESAAWLRQWGHPVRLHFVGSASPALETELRQRAEAAGVHVEITGFVDEATFRDHLLAVDLGVQLRVSPVLGVSGPLSDLAAWGTPAVASRGLTIDVESPPYVVALADDASPVGVAEVIEAQLHATEDAQAREMQRQAYLAAHTPGAYAAQLVGILTAVAQ